MAIGARSQSAKTYLEKNFESFENCTKEELMKHGLLALRDTLQSDMELTSKNCTIGIVSENEPFKIIEGDELQQYLDLLEGATRRTGPEVREPEPEQEPEIVQEQQDQQDQDQEPAPQAPMDF